ncbi:putative membrane protein [Acinetobacter baumannii 24975_1]|nr:putative membrane protein [Acinetobacter baumannii 24975_1]
MIESWFFVLAMLAVLLIPGPTNALLATAAHSQGLSKTFWLIPMEWLGYAYGISFWAVFSFGRSGLACTTAYFAHH